MPVDIAVIGGGPGGLSAAMAAAGAGAQVTLLDAYAMPGGQYYRQPPEGRGRLTHRQRQGRELWQRMQAAGVEIVSETLVWDLHAEQNAAQDPSRSAEQVLSITGPRGAGELRARAVILATGTYERTAPFPGWTLPGVITAGAAQMLLYNQVRPGRRVLLAGAGPLQLLVAQHLLAAGVEVVAVLEAARPRLGSFGQVPALWGQWERVGEGLAALAELARRRVPYRLGWGIVSAQGSPQVEGAVIARLDSRWRPIPGSQREVTCDTICTGYGFIPFNTLAKLAGAAMQWRPELGGEVPWRDARMQTSLPGLYAVGDGAGVGGYRLAIAEGQVAGQSAAAQVQGKGLSPVRARGLEREQAFQRLYARIFTPGPGLAELARPDTIVCRCEGVTQAQVLAAVEAGATTSAEVKALTRCGMGPCQGRVCGLHVAQTVARLTARPVEAVGLNSPRPPVFSLPLGQFLDLKN